MAIQKYNDQFSNELMPTSFGSMLDRFFNDNLNMRNIMGSFTPHVDSAETEDGYEIEVSLPGLKRDEINIDFQDGRLTISGERRFSEEKKNKKYHMIENQYGSFTRSFYLPDTVNPENIDANFEDGVLKISVPKDVTKAEKRRIEIKGSDSSKPVNGDRSNLVSGNKPVNGKRH